MRRITLVPALALAALVFAVAGCGGDDSSSTTSGASGAPLSKEDWIAQADAICKAGNQKTNQAAAQQFGNSQPSESDIQQFTAQVLVPTVRDELDQIRALTPPEGDEDQVNAIIDAASQAADQAEQDPSSAQTAFDQADQLAKSYGLKVCGQD